MTSVIDTTEQREIEGGQALPDTHDQPAALISQIREHQALRKATMRMQLRIANGARAYVRRLLGFQTDLEESTRTAINAKAAKVVTAIQKHKPAPEGTEDVALVAGIFVVRAGMAEKHFADYRKDLEKYLATAVHSLPVWPWVESVRGFGDLGLAIIIGECGDLSNYANPGKVWKRMGLAVFDGKAQGKRLDKIEAERNGYSPQRRSGMWTIGDSLIKGNQDGRYRTLYLERKAYELERKPDMTKMHAHRRAQRYMEKRLLRDLWRAWRSQPIDD